MPLLPLDEQHLATALGLARTAVGLTSPNPTVGCVLASGETILGQGAHHYDTYDHAEIVALKQAASLGHNIQGATAYVTLEPCSHHGRTGPCSDALIKAGIIRCVIATVDPNPLVSGSGIAKLRAAGIETIILDPASPLALEARTLNDAFTFFIQHKRPFITLKAALSVDGKLAPPPTERTSIAPHWVTGPAARTSVQPLRHAVDAILTGIGTVLADDPSLTDRSGLPRRRPLLRIVLDSELRTPLNSKLITTAADDLLLVCSNEAPLPAEYERLALGAQLLRLHPHEGRLNLNTLLTALAARNIQSILVEAGAAINGALLRADLVDKLVLYYSEREFGLNGVPFAQGYESPYVIQQRLTRTSHETFPNEGTTDIRITGYLHDPWSNV
ncbi:bifunctional diaminohydroxyphosphoribosylaminopyrimidine deaminase/5-amino-6-(5-phosphoribosylamino)uracil reductase RibD [Granulicella sp. 5B5]|uniref:bifunctional diaminohydroxyphosphoribosylaminopyrimidine deaminase/5-amino-6-(5-phosphoribosylamino)uracil reductase RibD n=1 Tax=Granulicella sp. 5B5 TaxID=1617967 RepID=UPI0015F52184|nr:bifunctional diaminohydroxyphosphoribosylaminopyrimidine deaminase/5-amino-6-(5-phosphoribosylamino)uracil reductase RibD [Granulicella sp. 5B5]QMV18262.1 bifunctional diaminohydroxyphosphoribosylaminopyrimidine deaminase/5-amino-6-(5-phosphoribosylamino)uracil reductase RibD [Granulicella sp. 5B5]